MNTASGLFKRMTVTALLACGTLVATQAAHAETAPRWEVGLGLGVLSVPFYRGADAGRTYVIPVPYIIYRGPYLQMDEGGVRGKLFDSERLKLDVSLAGGVPVPEDTDGARAGMPKLHPTLEVGPQLEYRLWQPEDRGASAWLHLPVRSVFSVGWGEFAHQGWVFSPYVEYKTGIGTLGAPWTVSLGAGPLFSDRSYHNYFYEVTANQATPTRGAYHPDAGYAGSRLTLTLHKRVGRWWLGGFARVDSLQGAVFGDSPLVREDVYYAVGAAVVTILGTSRKRAAPTADSP